ncbi:MAG: response regulator [Acidobacteria bacterium]|nr:MAG: response regulator [Acidobacteriota bacterium]
MSKPVILAVDDDPQVLAAFRRDLRSRYRNEYSILGAASGPEALDLLRELKSRGDALAMIISDQRMPSMLGIELLAQTRDLYPVARRLLLTAYSDIDAAVKGINQAHLDYYLSKPWDPPEECLFAPLDDLLDAWQVEHQPEYTGLRLVGHQWSPRSHAVKDFLAGNLVPYHWIDAARDPSAAVLLEAAGVGPEELPALLFDDGTVLRNPELRDLATRLGRPVTAAHPLYDLVIVGAGPAGLAAAVYGASEGLRTLLFDRIAPGGQAGTSSRIENYLGFPAGVSGSELTRRAVAQARRLGAEFLAPLDVKELAIDAGYKRIQLGDGKEVISPALVIATGMTYREHEAHGICDYTGAGVYYGAATIEAQAVKGGRVLIVGGGNSAGQSAMHLARFASEVQIIIRRESLRDTMSHYLIQQIEGTPNIRLRPCTVLTRVEGDGHLERVELHAADTNTRSVEPMDAVFIFIGTRPHADWLPPGILRDAKGFVLTGRDAAADPAFGKTWKEPREPLMLETSVPGIFAAGDVRAGAMNRVASAVGEGSMVVRLVHEYLALP